MRVRFSTTSTIFLLISLIVGVAMVFLTPPFRVPDEVGHFWHAYAIARGQLLPPVESGRAVVDLPEGARHLVGALWILPGSRETFNDRLRSAARLSYSERSRRVEYPAYYSPLPYLPQALGCFIGDLFHLRPLVTFYLGRMIGLFAVIAIMLAAIEASEVSAAVVATVGLLPMTLFLFASYSADAMTIALATLATVLARKPGKRFYVAALLIGLCKPPYLLVVLLAFATRRWRAAIYASMLALFGLALTFAFGSANTNAMRPDANPTVQLTTLREEPLRVAASIAHEIKVNAAEHLDEMVGRFGSLDVPIPRAAYWAVVALLLWVAALAGAKATRVERVAAVAIVLMCFVFVELSQYIIWTAPGRPIVDGVQGRYFIPLLPLAFIAFSYRIREQKLTPAVLVSVTVFANAGALLVLWQRYYA